MWNSDITFCLCRWFDFAVLLKAIILERCFGITYKKGKYFKINEKWVISKILNYFSSSTVFGVIRFSYFEFNHNVAERAKFSKGDFAKRHCNTETVDSNTDQTSACDTQSEKAFKNVSYV